MRFYRIKQIADDCYIPQVKKGLLGSWDGIDGHPIKNRHLDGEQYYEKTYGKD